MNASVYTLICLLMATIFGVNAFVSFCKLGEIAPKHMQKRFKWVETFVFQLAFTQMILLAFRVGDWASFAIAIAIVGGIWLCLDLSTSLWMFVDERRSKATPLDTTYRDAVTKQSNAFFAALSAQATRKDVGSSIALVEVWNRLLEGLNDRLVVGQGPLVVIPFNEIEVALNQGGDPNALNVEAFINRLPVMRSSVEGGTPEGFRVLTLLAKAGLRTNPRMLRGAFCA